MEIAIYMIMKLHILEWDILGNGDASRNLSSKVKFTNGMKIKISLIVKESVYSLHVFHLSLGVCSFLTLPCNETFIA